MRRLGVGGGGPGPGGERPLRAQLVVAICAAIVLLAVPLYLLRKPSGEADEAAASASAPLVPSITLTFDAGPAYEKVRLGAPQRHKCSASKGTRGQEGAMCDRLPFFEEALAKGIKDSVDCAPKTGKEGSINYALSIDFRRKKLTVFPGASGEWTGPKRSAPPSACCGRCRPPTGPACGTSISTI